MAAAATSSSYANPVQSLPHVEGDPGGFSVSGKALRLYCRVLTDFERESGLLARPDFSASALGASLDKALTKLYLEGESIFSATLVFVAAGFFLED